MFVLHFYCVDQSKKKNILFGKFKEFALEFAIASGTLIYICLFLRPSPKKVPGSLIQQRGRNRYRMEV